METVSFYWVVIAQFFGAFAKLWRGTVSFVMFCPSVRQHGKTRLSNGFSLNLIFEYFLEKMSKKFKFKWNWARIMVLYILTGMHFFIISCLVLRFRNVSDKICRENENTHFMFNNVSFDNRAVNEIVSLRPQITKSRMPIARWIPKSSNTRSECVVLIAFLLLQWLHERASVLHYTYEYIVCHVIDVKYQRQCDN
jgi:hypothetical protein